MKLVWNLKQFYCAWQEDLLRCHTSLEKGMCDSINLKEFLNLAESIKQSRKLTPGELSILSKVRGDFIL